MAAFFAIPNIDIPGVRWGIGFVAGIIRSFPHLLPLDSIKGIANDYTVLMTVAIASPLIFLAFYVDNVRSRFEARTRTPAPEAKLQSDETSAIVDRAQNLSRKATNQQHKAAGNDLEQGHVR